MHWRFSDMDSSQLTINRQKQEKGKTHKICLVSLDVSTSRSRMQKGSLYTENLPLHLYNDAVAHNSIHTLICFSYLLKCLPLFNGKLLLQGTSLFLPIFSTAFPAVNNWNSIVLQGLESDPSFSPLETSMNLQIQIIFSCACASTETYIQTVT